ncbi:MAG: hypothetical protein KatS3mg058_2850 [Roseiflexus sp.]|nr:MAG: hypothetical protein KatS3mg058_2850 [Roseiflexus sp.]
MPCPPRTALPHPPRGVGVPPFAGDGGRPYCGLKPSLRTGKPLRVQAVMVIVPSRRAPRVTVTRAGR